MFVLCKKCVNRAGLGKEGEVIYGGDGVRIRYRCRKKRIGFSVL